MTNTITPVILSGGTGTRLWPLSTQDLPKQFMPLLSNESLLQETATRLLQFSNITSPIVVCNIKHRALVEQQLNEIGIAPQTIFLEPVGRNTAPAIALVAMHALLNKRDPILFILPSDHAIQNPKKLQIAINLAQIYAEQGKLVTFGITPTRAETGYGYIKCSEQLGNEHAYIIERFVEKPDLITAQQYLEAECYYWNSGMFMFRASVFLQELKSFAPDIYSACEKVLSYATQNASAVMLPHEIFAACPSNSIDYAVMEKTQKGVMISLTDAGWSDIGSWQALWEHGTKDSQNNVVIGDAILGNTKNSYVHTKKLKVITLGVQDIIIIASEDAILITHKDECQNIKKYL